MKTKKLQQETIKNYQQNDQGEGKLIKNHLYYFFDLEKKNDKVK